MDGTEAFQFERRRQVEQKGYGPAHDSKHAEGELVAAAIAYAEFAGAQVNGMLTPDDFKDGAVPEPPDAWPWDVSLWRPHVLAKNNLKKAGALLAAEWDRIEAMSR